DLTASLAPETDPGFGNTAALLANVLPFCATQRGEEVIEARVLLVTPVELDAAPQQATRILPFVRLVLIRKKDVQRRHLIGQLQYGVAQLCARFVRAEQARAGDGREGHGGQELGVVAQAATFIGVRPGPVEHVFAIDRKSTRLNSSHVKN